MSEIKTWEVIIVGGGVAGLSAAVYLGRAQRETLVIDSGKSMAKWEPDIRNYQGFRFPRGFQEGNCCNADSNKPDGARPIV